MAQLKGGRQKTIAHTWAFFLIANLFREPNPWVLIHGHTTIAFPLF